MAFSSSSNSTAHVTIPTLSNLSFTIDVKPHSSNYHVWKAQALPYFRGHDLFGYLDGTISIPPKEIDFSNSNTGAIQKNSKSSIKSLASSGFLNPNHHQLLTHRRCPHSSHVLHHISWGMACTLEQLLFFFPC